MTYVFDKEHLRKHGLARSEVSIFVDRQVLRKDTGYQNCYVFLHLHIQEFFAAMVFMLQDSWGARDSCLQSLEDLELLLESSSSEDPHLLQTKCFLFGLLKEERVRHLEAAFHCKMSLEMQWKTLQWLERLANSEPLPSHLVLPELFYRLHETQGEACVSQAMRCFQKVVISIGKELHLLVSSFCLKHCRPLRAIELSVAVVLGKKLPWSSRAETGPRAGGRSPRGWQDLWSVLRTPEHLRELDLSGSNLDELAVQIFSQELRRPSCHLQKLLLRFISFPEACQAISRSLAHSQNLTRLDPKGSEIGDNGVKSLCEALRHPGCKLQNLSLESCDLTAVCCLNISRALIRSRSLVSLNLSTNNLLDDGVTLLCEGLTHPLCRLERLLLESCGLSAAGCEGLSSALSSNDRLTHLCLADNVLGDGGVSLVSDALKQPRCTLQSLVLRHCHFTSLGSECLSASLLCSQSLTHLDLGANRLQDAGVKLLCNVLRHPRCELRDLELMGCVLTGACCPDLASAPWNNPNLQSLDLGSNDLREGGVRILLEALRHPNCNIQRLGISPSALSSNQKLIKISLTLNTLGCEGIVKLCGVLRSPECKLQVLGLCQEAFDDQEAQKLLDAVRGSNPRLVIKQDCTDPQDAGSWWRCF